MKLKIKIISLLIISLPTITCIASVVNNQITDSVTQTNVKVVGEAPTLVMSNLYISTSKSSGLLFNNNCIIHNNGSNPIRITQNIRLQPQETITHPCQSPGLLRDKLKQQIQSQ